MMDRQNAHLYNSTRHFMVFRKDFEGHPKNWEHGYNQENHGVSLFGSAAVH